MAKQPTHPSEEPDRPSHGRPDHDLPGRSDRPGAHPDQDLSEKEEEEPDTPQPKGASGRSTRDAKRAPTTSLATLLPPSAAVGDPSFVVRVIGAGFNDTSVIVFAGQDEPTTFVSPAELTTLVDMSVWLGADPAIPVLVRTTLSTGLPEESNTVTFAFTPPREVPLEEAHASIPVPTMDLITRM